MYTNVTDGFLAAINGAEPNYCCKLDFGNNVIVDDFFSVNYSGGSCDGSSIKPGSTVISNVKAELTELPTTVIKGSCCSLYFGVNSEYVPYNIFTINKIEKNGERFSITLEDNMSKTEKGYFSSLTFPSTTLAILAEISSKTGVSFDTTGLTAIPINDKPEGYTCREIIGYIAGLYGKFAICNRDGKIAFKWYDTANPVQLSEYCFDTPTLDTVDTVIGRVVCNGYSSGSGTAIDYDCIFMTQAQLETVFASLNGFTYRTGSLNLRLGNILIDPWDMVSITYGGETIKIPAGVVTITYNGGMLMEIEAPSEETSADEEGYKSPLTKQMERLVTELLSAKELIAEKADISELNAQIANLENVYAAKAVVNNLSVLVAEINDAYISSAKVEELYAQKAEVEKLYAKKAEFDTLLADTANFKSLSSDIGKIDTLIFGSASGDVIQTSFANAVIAQLGNAQISSAMIAEIDAGKITSGSIYTNKVRIYGDENNLLSIIDNTIAISDGTHTRVQIGKDANNDYSMYVWDASGNLMFDALGLTENGITRQIIRDDVVKDDANISASKLNIDSLFGVINEDDSHTLKSTKIYLDDEEQTLQVAFAGLTKKVTEQGDTISSQGTSIETIQGQITSKIWQQDITDATSPLGENIALLSTQYSEVAQDLSGFKTTVGETYTTKEDFEGLEIGGRNLLVKSDDAAIDERWGNQNSVTSNTYDIDTKSRHYITPDSGNDNNGMQLRLDLGVWYNGDKFKPGDKLVFSIDLKGEIFGNYGMFLGAFYTDTNGQRWRRPSETISTINDKVLENEFKRFDYVFTIPQDYASELILNVSCRYADFYVKRPKLELGNKATDWTPAPEDLETSITAVKTMATQNADKFNWLVKSGTNATDFTLTDRTATLISDYINLNGLVTFSGLGSDAVDTIKGYSTDAINNLEIGGRNLLFASTLCYKSLPSNANFKMQHVNTVPYREFTNEGIHYKTDANTNTPNNSWGIKISMSQMGLNIGDTIAISYDVKGIFGTVNMGLTIMHATSSSSNFYAKLHEKINGSSHPAEGYSDWARIKGIFTIDSDIGNTDYLYIFFGGGYGEHDADVYVKNVKIEKGNKPTDWTPAPEDIDTAISDASIANWCYQNNKTYIDGGKIYTGTVTAEKIAAGAITADKIAAGAITADKISSNAVTAEKIAANAITAEKIATDAIKSTNYNYSSGNFSAAGTFLDLSSGLFRSKNFALDSAGNAYFKGVLSSTSGIIGGFTIGASALYNGAGSYENGRNGTAGIYVGTTCLGSYTSNYGCEIGTGQCRFYSKGDELGWISPISTDFSDPTLTAFAISAGKNLAGGTVPYSRLHIGYQESNGAFNPCIKIAGNAAVGELSGYHMQFTTDTVCTGRFIIGSSGLQTSGNILGVCQVVVIGTSSTKIAYQTGRTKALIEFWKTLIGSGTTASTCSSTVYDSVLVTGLSSSMTAVNGKVISNGPDFTFTYSISTAGEITPGGNFSKFRVTYFN